MATHFWKYHVLIWRYEDFLWVQRHRAIRQSVCTVQSLVTGSISLSWGCGFRRGLGPIYCTIHLHLPHSQLHSGYLVLHINKVWDSQGGKKKSVLKVDTAGVKVPWYWILLYLYHFHDADLLLKHKLLLCHAGFLVKIQHHNVSWWICELNDDSILLRYLNFMRHLK